MLDLLTIKNPSIDIKATTSAFMSWKGLVPMLEQFRNCKDTEHISYLEITEEGIIFHFGIEEKENGQ